MGTGRSSILVRSSAQDSLATWWPLDRHHATIWRAYTWPVRWNCSPVMISLEVMCCGYMHILGIVQMLTVYNLSLPLPMIALFLSVTFLVNLFLMPFSFPFFLTSVCVGPPWTGRGRLAVLIWTCPLCINALSLEFFIYWLQGYTVLSLLMIAFFLSVPFSCQICYSLALLFFLLICLSRILLPCLNGILLPCLCGILLLCLSGVLPNFFVGSYSPVFSGIPLPCLSGILLPYLCGILLPVLVGSCSPYFLDPAPLTLLNPAPLVGSCSPVFVGSCSPVFSEVLLPCLNGILLPCL